MNRRDFFAMLTSLIAFCPSKKPGGEFVAPLRLRWIAYDLGGTAKSTIVGHKNFKMEPTRMNIRVDLPRTNAAIRNTLRGRKTLETFKSLVETT